MRKFISFVPFLLAIALAVSVVLFTLRAKPEQNKPHSNNELLQQRLDSIQSTFEATREQRDSLLRDIDNLHISRAVDSAVIKSLQGEVKQLRGKYHAVPQDSLGMIMDRRADGLAH